MRDVFRAIGVALLISLLWLGLLATIFASAYQCSPASAVREQYRIFQLEKSKTTRMMEESLRQ
jgi:hypothetical protein